MNQEINKRRKIHAFTLYVKVPQTDQIQLQSWDMDCKMNFKDDRFIKMLHDHNFYSHFAERMSNIEKKLDEIIKLSLPKQESKKHEGIVNQE